MMKEGDVRIALGGVTIQKSSEIGCAGVWMESGSRGGRLRPGQLTAEGCICFYVLREMKVRKRTGSDTVTALQM